MDIQLILGFKLNLNVWISTANNTVYDYSSDSTISTHTHTHYTHTYFVMASLPHNNKVEGEVVGS